MNKKQKEVELAKLKDEEKELKKLKAIYKKAVEDIAKKIEISNGKASVLLENWDNLTDEEKSIYQSQIYQRGFQKSFQKQIDGILSDLNSKQYKSIDDYMSKSYETGYIGSLYDLHGQDIPLIMPIDQKQVVKAMTTDSKISKKLYTKLGEDVDFLKKRIASNLSRGIATGSEWKVIARNIAADSNVGFNRAMRIARTEGHRIQVAAADDAQHAAKKAGVDVVKQWDAALDGRTRPTYRKLDGQIRELDEPFEVDGMEVMRPSEFGRPEEDINCRCALLQRARWALDEDELQTLKDRAAYYGLDKTKDFEDFANKYLNVAGSSGKMALKTGFRTITGSHTIENDIGTPDSPVCNPNFKKEGNYAKNCGYCSATYEMRRRGYDVVANPLNTMYVSDWVELFDGATPKHYVHKKGIPIVDQLSDQLLKAHGNGARGSVFVQWKGKRIGHFFSWEIENGKARFVDGQNGNNDAADYFARVRPDSIITIRWDGLQPSQAIDTACKNRG